MASVGINQVMSKGSTAVQAAGEKVAVLVAKKDINLNDLITPRLLSAIVLACIGLSISIAGMLAFRRAKTTVNPVKASLASSLVVQGVYRYTRNPMYVGLLLTLLAWAVFLANPLAVLWVVVYVLYITRFQIIPEERVLASLFGAEYEAYKGRVRRWV